MSEIHVREALCQQVDHTTQIHMVVPQKWELIPSPSLKNRCQRQLYCQLKNETVNKFCTDQNLRMSQMSQIEEFVTSPQVVCHHKKCPLQSRHHYLCMNVPPLCQDWRAQLPWKIGQQG